MIAIYPGSFDPPTNGHLDIIARAAQFCDKLIVAVANNSAKRPFLTADERIHYIKEITSSFPNVSVASFQGLTVDFAKSQGADAIIRGLRAVSDFEYEFQMALTNRNLNERLETLFISTSLQYLYLSSSIVREVLVLGGDISGMVPPRVLELLNSREAKA